MALGSLVLGAALAIPFVALMAWLSEPAAFWVGVFGGMGLGGVIVGSLHECWEYWKLRRLYKGHPNKLRAKLSRLERTHFGGRKQPQ